MRSHVVEPGGSYSLDEAAPEPVVTLLSMGGVLLSTREGEGVGVIGQGCKVFPDQVGDERGHQQFPTLVILIGGPLAEALDDRSIRSARFGDEASPTARWCACLRPCRLVRLRMFLRRCWNG
ncbi:hypothetical protein ACLQ24_18290 [Micromonospora sp. DT4]|uniref:hypothetical protein n=1 Tax=Micromonospora sp. DT4 TaxID=3393438 RepID=UPI003CF3DF71